ncbi:PHP domain-containing protein [Paenibacillus sp. IB182496]|uniref:PHP domain-containing protein n=1 Tax=Paenibacillus sabuli TaxID=2772509 RepID=A0A927BUV9_9BACL|nr:PHP domain-containing protein [Paenibacillus sabuli]MBD2846170.1 PHP domain-containing protein [Paenibacillus sabuli]
MAITDQRADLHAHTTASDGMLAPGALVRLAAQAGLAAVAVTDHDTTAGVDEALAEGARLGVEVVPGIEISAYADDQAIHVLGYCMDLGDADWQRRIEGLRGGRQRRNEQIVARLNALGIALTMEQVRRIAGKAGTAEETLGRPHIAAALVACGAAASVTDAFERYLGSGCAAYVAIPRLSPHEAVGWIREAGGAAVIAHPGLYRRDDLVERLLRGGAAGLEVSHPDHDGEDERRYRALAERCGAIATAGSDFHGEREGGAYHGALGSRSVPVEVLRRIARACGDAT